ncbi:MAG TPA: hypothetical protein VL357_06440 [Rariglobus sp.]|jgi:hypothetical protein|nr:hypothetical protein [Rariglobus sp.]
MISRFKKQGRWLVGLIGLYVVVASLLNTLVNPLRMEPASLSIAAFDPYRDIGEDLRTGKAGLVRYHSGVEVAIIGSSRFEIGIDPTHPAFKEAATLNLAMAAGGLHENVAMARYLMARQPHLKRLIFGLDMADLSSDTDSRKFTSFYTSPLAESTASLDREIRYVVGIGASEDSTATISRYVRRLTPSRTPLGRWVTPRNPRDLRAYLTANRDVIFDQIPDMYELRPQALRSAKIEKLRALLVDLRRRGVEVLVVIPPQLAVKQLHPFLDELKVAPWNTDRRGIYELCREVNAVKIDGAPAVQLWDFATFSAQTCVALPPLSGDPVRRVPHWFDMGHFDETIGSAMINRMLGATTPPADQPLSETFGVNVLQVGIEPHLEGLQLGHARYCREHPADVAWARSIFPKIDLKGSSPSKNAAGEEE